jgi:hypothetical protein
MALKDPVVVYYAKTNTEAAMLCHMLNQAGCEAHLMEDNNFLGFWMGGTLPTLHWPKVWVERANGERAAELLRQFEQTRRDREADRAQPDWDRTIVTTECEECGERVAFSARVLGSVQNCPYCGKHIDVEEEKPDEYWGEPEIEEPRPEDENDDDEKWS